VVSAGFAAPDLRWILVAACLPARSGEPTTSGRSFSPCSSLPSSHLHSRGRFGPALSAMARAGQSPLFGSTCTADGFLGLATYGLWAAARLADTPVSKRDRGFPCFIGVLAAAATLINPWGRRCGPFLGDTVRPARADIEEWSPITQYPLALGIPWILATASRRCSNCAKSSSCPLRLHRDRCEPRRSVISGWPPRRLLRTCCCHPVCPATWNAVDDARVSASSRAATWVAVITVVTIRRHHRPASAFRRPLRDVPADHGAAGRQI
jgi:hypothetical protein